MKRIRERPVWADAYSENGISSGIYRIKSKASGKFYIGSAVNLSSRWSLHIHMLRKGTHHSPQLSRAFKKYGEGNLEFTVLEFVPDKTLLIRREQHWMDTLNPDYNSRPLAHSQLGYVCSEEQRKKMSERARGRKWSPEQRAKFIEKMVGRKWTVEQRERMKAIKRTPEWCAKISASLTGKTLSPEIREKISQTKRAQKRKSPMREETKKKLSLALMGNKNGKITPQCLAASAEARRNRLLSLESRMKMRESRLKYMRKTLANFLIVMKPTDAQLRAWAA